MLLILREEMICAVILIFLIFYYALNKIKDKRMRFLQLSCAGLLHVTFDIITVITVNRQDVVPDSVNRLLHIVFYMSSIWFIQSFYHYIIELCALYRHRVFLKTLGYVLFFVFTVLLLLLPMEYVEGHGTYYSYGPLAFAGYGLFVVYCMASMIVLLMSQKKLENRVRYALIPMIIVMFGAVMAQALIPELLMTSAGITFVCLGLFVALDNPDKDFREQALWDSLTGLKSRNCYNRDFEQYVYEFKRRKKKIQKVGFVVADLNFLKKVNDTYGHVEGDRLIAAAAHVLKDTLKSAEDIYRLGGDEFAAIYLSPDDRIVTGELEQVDYVSRQITGHPVPLRIAVGYASGPSDENIGVVFGKADEAMYENKIKMKQGEQPR